jgi:hypothetical protein
VEWRKTHKKDKHAFLLIRTSSTGFGGAGLREDFMILILGNRSAENDQTSGHGSDNGHGD